MFYVSVKLFQFDFSFVQLFGQLQEIDKKWPHRKKTCLLGLRISKARISLLSYIH